MPLSHECVGRKTNPRAVQFDVNKTVLHSLHGLLIVNPMAGPGQRQREAEKVTEFLKQAASS